jgi:nitrite reductase/ring-hydroxylating ferredoxin subunit
MPRREVFVPLFDEKNLKEDTMQLAFAQDLPYILIKKKNDIFAFLDECPHRGRPLSDGYLVDYTIICPYHNCCFDIRTGENIGNVTWGIKKYECKVQDGKIWIKLQ